MRPIAGFLSLGALIATVSWVLLSRDPGGTVPRSAQAEPSTSAPAAREGSVTKGRVPERGSGRSPSPLNRSPGYYPPDDPESLSVITGRRDAPAVALELSGGALSLEDFARLLLAGLQARDERAIHALRVTRREFDLILWPEFPESRPITRITSQDAWDLSEPTSRTGVARSVGLYGGRQLSLVRVTASRREAFRNFTLHREVTIEARDAGDGSIARIRFASTVVERRGRFKGLIYKD
jgi:hypothetical protein